MDHFGIGAAMEAMALSYSLSARRTGRTTSLVDSVKDGDRIIFLNSKEAERVKNLCFERGVKVECIVVDPRDPYRVMELAQPDGRTIFDHSWVESYYMIILEEAAATLDRLQQETSGYGAHHRETSRRAEEMASYKPKPTVWRKG